MVGDLKETPNGTIIASQYNKQQRIDENIPENVYSLLDKHKRRKTGGQ